MLKIAIASGLVLATLTGGAFAADLARPMKVAPVVAAPAASNWDGLYLGANIGYGPGTATSDGFGSTSTTIDFSGLFVGGQIGYNFHLSDNIVLGIEGDLNWANETGTTHFIDGNYDGTDAINWTGAVTGKIGYDAGTFMPYVLGGVAFAGNTLSYYDDDLQQSNGSQSATHTGYTVGLGLAAAVASNVSVFGEYRYSDYGTQTYGLDTGDVRLTDNSVRGGVNFHF